MSEAQPRAPLRRGWTTGACASGAARAAFDALLTGVFPDPVRVALPKGLRPEFALATQELGADFARAGIVKDAGDDPDVTHGALIRGDGALRSEGRGGQLPGGRGRRHGDAARPSAAARRARDQPCPARDDLRQSRRSRREDRRRLRRDCRDFRARRRKDRRAHRQRAAWHRRRPVDPRHDRRRRALFVLGLDPFDHERRRRRAGERLRPYRRGDGRDVGGRHPRALRSARSRADRHGRLRRRAARSICAPIRCPASPSPAARRN